MTLQEQIDSASPGSVIDMGGATHAPSRQGSAYHCLRLHSGITLRNGTLTMPPVAPSVRLVRVEDGALEDVTLTAEGQGEPSEHRHGVFATGPCRLLRVTASGFTGDGFYFYTGSDHSSVHGCTATGNGRNGLTMGGGDLVGMRVTSCLFEGNAAQQLDSEGISTSDVIVAGCTLRGGPDYALTVSGSPSTQSRDWLVTGCVIDGAVNVVWAEGVRLVGNTGTNPTTKPCVDIWRCSEVEVAACVLHMTQDTVPHMGVVRAQGTGPGSCPTVTVAGCTLSAASPEAMVVRVTGGKRAAVVGSRLQGGACGVYLRGTIPEDPFEYAEVRGNVITGFRRAPVEVGSSGSAHLLRLVTS